MPRGTVILCEVVGQRQWTKFHLSAAGFCQNPGPNGICGEVPPGFTMRICAWFIAASPAPHSILLNVPFRLELHCNMHLNVPPLAEIAACPTISGQSGFKCFKAGSECELLAGTPNDFHTLCKTSCKTQQCVLSPQSIFGPFVCT